MLPTIIFFTILITFTNAGCPSMCNCTKSAVICMEKNLDYVPNFESLQNSPVIIDLSGNEIDYISGKDFSFDKSDEVKEIYLNNSEIIDIDSETFEETENLQELYLGQNLLNSVPEDLIEHLDNMILLDLSNNYFSGDMPKIRSKRLEVLAIANSKITNIPDDSLQYLPNLKLLLLQQNNIKSLSPAVFQHIKHSHFFVKLSYNTWECNCKNIELFRFLANKNFIDSSEPYQCLNNKREFVNIYNRSGNISNFSEECQSDDSANKTKQSAIDVKSAATETNATTGENVVVNAKSYSQIKLNENISDQSMEKLELTNMELNNNCRDVNLRSLINSITLSLFVALTIAFVLGFLSGLCVYQFVVAVKYKKLETSDSRTKLISP